VKKAGTISQLQAGPDFVIFANSTTVAPPEVFRVSADGSSTKKLTDENAQWLNQVSMPQYESLTVAGAAGASVQYWLFEAAEL
jgi:dipeptidyl aminopeptidase/acylaminoacyl peptidase